MRIQTSKSEAEGVSGEAAAMREQEVAQAQESARTEQGRKEAEKEKRVFVATQEAESVKGENESKANIAEYDATLNEKRAEAKRRGEVALANAEKIVLEAQKLEEIARLEKTELAQKEIDKRKIEIEAEAEAERRRRIARGEADAILAKFEAEAEGTRKVLDAKAEGYRNLLASVEDDKALAPTLLLVEQLPTLVDAQVRAIQNLKIDKVTVWDSGENGKGQSTTSGFLRSLIGALPPIHDLAKQAGVDLPEYLGEIEHNTKTGMNGATTPSAPPSVDA